MADATKPDAKASSPGKPDAAPDAGSSAPTSTGGTTATPAQQPATEAGVAKPATSNPAKPAANTPATPAAAGATAGIAPTPVAKPADRAGATGNAAGKSSQDKSSPDKPSPDKSSSAPESAKASLSGSTAAPAYQPRKPTSDWSPDGAAIAPARPSVIRPLLLGAAGGAIAALLMIGVIGIGSRPATPPPAPNDGKIATAMEELEKERAAATANATAQGTAMAAVEKTAADLGARIDALEQKSGAATVTPQTGLADAAQESIKERIKALELKVAALESGAGGGSAAATTREYGARDDNAVAALNQRMASLEQRLADTGARPVDPSVGSSSPVETPQLQPQQAYAPNDDGAGALRPPGLIPEPVRPAEQPRPAGPVRGWVLHNVYGGVAVLEGRSAGIVEVRRGQSVPGLGRIAGIDRRGDRWIVSTDRGVISAPAY